MTSSRKKRPSKTSPTKKVSGKNSSKKADPPVGEVTNSPATSGNISGLGGGSSKIFAGVCTLLDYVKNLSDSVNKLGGEVTQLATFGTTLRTAARVNHLSSGQMKSWEINGGSYFDYKKVLSIANDVAEDRNGDMAKNLESIGVDKTSIDKGDTNAIALEIIKHLPEFYNSTVEKQKTRGNILKEFDNKKIGPLRELARNLAGLHTAELNDIIAKLKDDPRRFELPDKPLYNEQLAFISIQRAEAIAATEKVRHSHAAAAYGANSLNRIVNGFDDTAQNYYAAHGQPSGQDYALFRVGMTFAEPLISMVTDAICKNTGLPEDSEGQPPEEDQSHEKQTKKSSSSDKKKRPSPQPANGKKPSPKPPPQNTLNSPPLSGHTGSPTEAQIDKDSIFATLGALTAAIGNALLWEENVAASLAAPAIERELPGDIHASNTHTNPDGHSLVDYASFMPSAIAEENRMKPSNLYNNTLKQNSSTSNLSQLIKPVSFHIDRRQNQNAYASIHHNPLNSSSQSEDIIIQINNMTGQDFSASAIASRTA